MAEPTIIQTNSAVVYGDFPRCDKCGVELREDENHDICDHCLRKEQEWSE